MRGASVYNIPAGVSFADCLARGVMEETEADPALLADMTILLPTRRAVRTLRDAFLRQTDGRPLLLPRLGPVGDIDEDELILTHAEDEMSLPPAISPLQRQIILAKLVAARGQSRGFEQDMALAAALGRLMDQIYTEGLTFDTLSLAVDRADFARHWQVSLDFLSIVGEYWPAILKERGMMDASQRRDMLIRMAAAHWQENPPRARIIAAGSTGSIPATALLLKTIAHLPRGSVILPGLDLDMDGQSWAAIDDAHPQAVLRGLLKQMEVSRADIAVYPAAQAESAGTHAMRAFAAEVMRPAATSDAWRSAHQRLALTRGDIPVHRYDCETAQEESTLIACIFRAVLETPEKTAALVTPDRKLARRVAAACRRWNIDVDDSAGQPLSRTKRGLFLILCLNAARADLAPVALLDFCKHGLCASRLGEGWLHCVRDADSRLLRGPAFKTGLDAYAQKIALLAAEGRGTDSLSRFLREIENAFAPLLSLLTATGAHPFSQWLDAHLHAAEYFCAGDTLWQGDDGAAAALFLTELRESADDLPALNADDYAALIADGMERIPVRARHRSHARLSILGQLEARMAAADVMILGGLNEGTWPPAPAADPWMSRPMRQRAKLPSPERSVGLAAHDFVQSLCAGDVILTRAARIDGAATIPARWLQRMDAVLEACGLRDALGDGAMLAIARALDHTEIFKPVQRPAPCPPLPARPREISVTRVETWMNDPYSIYARAILKLRPLDPLEQDLDAAIRGVLIHTVLDRFVAHYPDSIGADAKAVFSSLVKEELDRLSPDADIRTLWEPRIARLGEWLIAHEHVWRTQWKPASREIKGRMVLEGPGGPFVLTGIADRIDKTRDGREAAIIDYKSAGAYRAKGMISGKYPQLPLEALILENGGFADCGMPRTQSLSYWILKGNREGGEVIALEGETDLRKAVEAARTGLQALVDLFDDESTPYYSLPHMERAPRYNDYEHLARVKEWTALDGAGEEEMETST